jgi:hypothetical protein
LFVSVLDRSCANTGACGRLGRAVRWNMRNLCRFDRDRHNVESRTSNAAGHDATGPSTGESVVPAKAPDDRDAPSTGVAMAT